MNSAQYFESTSQIPIAEQDIYENDSGIGNIQFDKSFGQNSRCIHNQTSNSEKLSSLDGHIVPKIKVFAE